MHQDYPIIKSIYESLKKIPEGSSFKLNGNEIYKKSNGGIVEVEQICNICGYKDTLDKLQFHILIEHQNELKKLDKMTPAISNAYNMINKMQEGYKFRFNGKTYKKYRGKIIEVKK